MSRCVAVLCLALLCALPVSARVLEITVVSDATEARSEVARQESSQSFAGIAVKVSRPVDRAVALALHESATLLDTLGITTQLGTLSLDPVTAIAPQLNAAPKGSLLVLDLPLSLMERVATEADRLGRATVNVRHSDAYLRDVLCLPTLFHTIPSDRMYFDALGQFLVFRGWRKILVVRGPSDQDAARAETLTASLRKFGATVEAVREFSLSHHPDDRDKNTPEFLTGGVSYDAVAVIDSDGDYGRYVQYSTRRPRPVVGDVGLKASGWHYALERYGAPQLNERYRAFADYPRLHGRAAMTDVEFAAWAAVKLIANSVGTLAADVPLDVLSILTDPASQVDLYKGTRGSIRQWNNQLRQPILLGSADAVIAVAPMPKFLHPTHYVDTLGIDQPESTCQLR